MGNPGGIVRRDAAFAGLSQERGQLPRCKTPEKWTDFAVLKREERNYGDDERGRC